MQNLNNLSMISAKSVDFAKKEIATFGSPDFEIFDISLKKGEWLANELKANKELVSIGISFMDFKLGQSIKEGRVNEHIRMSMDAASEFLENEEISGDQKKIILNAIEAHHGNVKFNSIESEICTNADCYRFLDPRAIFVVFSIFKNRTGDTDKSLKMLLNKMDEKIALASLDIVKKDVSQTYTDFKRYMMAAI